MRKERRMKTENNKPYQYWLMNVKGAGRKRKMELLRKLGSAEAVYDAAEKELAALVGEKAAGRILEAKKDWDILAEYEKLCRQKIKFTCYGDADYPERLSEIPDAPFGLYYMGHLPSDKIPSVALIGARACSEYGMYAAREFGSKLAETGIQIISGLAMGIDGISQEAALLAGGESFGVLGCGVDVCYPKSNRGLYERCRQQGGLLSEYPPGTKPKASLFPPRNRIISGLSDLVVVIEAREKSGTLITVDMALEQGREILAVPGRITDSLSRGCNHLFRQGAGVAASPADVLEALYNCFGGAGGGGSAGKAAGTGRRGGDMEHTAINIEETETADGTRKYAGMEKIWLNTLSAGEKQIYEVLEILPKTPEEILHQAGGKHTIQDVFGILVELCLKGFAEQKPGGYCQKILAS